MSSKPRRRLKIVGKPLASLGTVLVDNMNRNIGSWSIPTTGVLSYSEVGWGVHPHLQRSPLHCTHQFTSSAEVTSHSTHALEYDNYHNENTVSSPGCPSLTHEDTILILQGCYPCRRIQTKSRLFTAHHVKLGQRVPLLEEVVVKIQRFLRHFEGERAQVALARGGVDANRHPPLFGASLNVVELPDAERQQVRRHLGVEEGREGDN